MSLFIELNYLVLFIIILMFNLASCAIAPEISKEDIAPVR